MTVPVGWHRSEGTTPSNRDSPNRRRAMTLFELVLVLVLLVVVGSLSAPLFEGSFASIRLRRGTDQVLASWSQARTHAIESGEIYQFRFEPAGNKYRVEPWREGLDDPSLDLDELSLDAQVTDEESSVATWEHEASLPEGIEFTTAEVVREVESGQRQLTRLDQSGLEQWSQPILFFPDGTTSSAALLLRSSKGLYRRATLRSLTGVGRASELLTREEVDRQRSR